MWVIILPCTAFVLQLILNVLVKSLHEVLRENPR